MPACRILTARCRRSAQSKRREGSAALHGGARARCRPAESRKRHIPGAACRRPQGETTVPLEVVRYKLQTLHGAIDDGSVAVCIPEHAAKSWNLTSSPFDGEPARPDLAKDRVLVRGEKAHAQLGTAPSVLRMGCGKMFAATIGVVRAS